MCPIILSPSPCLGYSCKFPWWVAYYAFVLSWTCSKLFMQIEKASLEGSCLFPSHCKDFISRHLGSRIRGYWPKWVCTLQPASMLCNMSWGFKGPGVQHSSRNMTARARQQPSLGPSAEQSSVQNLCGYERNRRPDPCSQEAHYVVGERAKPHETSEAAHRETQSSLAVSQESKGVNKGRWGQSWKLS